MSNMKSPKKSNAGLIVGLVLLTLVAIAVCALIFFGPKTVTYTVDGVSEKLTVNYGGIATDLKAPQKDEFNFLGWFSDKDGSKWDPETPVTENISVTAKWEWIPHKEHDWADECATNCSNVNCSETRTAPHKFLTDCDTVCAGCGDTRDPIREHDWTNACDTDCNICGATRTTKHVYSNDCDNSCNVCGAKRSVPDHVYDHACDTTCNVCGKTRSVSDHVYDNDCDTTCNVVGEGENGVACGYVREVPPHVYDHACDTTCNVCDAVREVEDHVYDNACDTTCNVVGEGEDGVTIAEFK